MEARETVCTGESTRKTKGECDGVTLESLLMRLKVVQSSEGMSPRVRRAGAFRRGCRDHVSHSAGDFCEEFGVVQAQRTAH